MSKFASLVAVGLTLLASFLVRPDECDGANLWQATSLGIGGAGLWMDQGGEPAFRDFEAAGRASISITPHISAVGSVSYGFDRQAVRGSGGFRLTATDVNNRDFSVGVGVSRHVESVPGSGLDEAAAEAAIGWRPLAGSPIILTGLAAYGVDTGRRLFNVAVIIPLHKGGVE